MDDQYLVSKFQIHRSDPLFKQLDKMTFDSKNLYNTCLYRERQAFFARRADRSSPGVINKYKLISALQNENQADYRSLPAAVAQQVCIQVYDSFKGFFAEIKNNQQTNIPHYKHKTKGRNKLVFTLNVISEKYLRNGYIKLTGIDYKFKVPSHIDCNTIKQVIITPAYNEVINVIICYQVPQVQLKPDNNRYMGIDLGVSNVMTCVTNTKDVKPFIIDGKKIKSVNQHYNKQMANLQSKNDKNKNNIKRTHKMCSVTKNRNNKLEDFAHKISKFICEVALSKCINTIIIGKNDNWKQQVNLGDKNNQNFVQIPYNKFIDKIKYKCALKGINVVLTEESYTSKCSFFDNEEMAHHDVYQGKRIRRGLFKLSNGKTINADVNGALNIIRKVHPMIVNDLGIADVAHPVRISTSCVNTKFAMTL